MFGFCLVDVVNEAGFDNCRWLMIEVRVIRLGQVVENL